MVLLGRSAPWFGNLRSGKGPWRGSSGLDGSFEAKGLMAGWSFSFFFIFDLSDDISSSSLCRNLIDDLWSVCSSVIMAFSCVISSKSHHRVFLSRRSISIYQTREEEEKRIGHGFAEQTPRDGHDEIVCICSILFTWSNSSRDLDLLMMLLLLMFCLLLGMAGWWVITRWIQSTTICRCSTSLSMAPLTVILSVSFVLLIDCAYKLLVEMP